MDRSWNRNEEPYYNLTFARIFIVVGSGNRKNGAMAECEEDRIALQ